MGVIPQDIKDAADNAPGGKFIKAAEFEGKGLILRVVSFEKILAKNPKFGANEKDALYEQKILGDKETFLYTFQWKENKDAEMVERVVESKSLALFIAFRDADPNPGDVVQISKDGKMENTRYTVKVVKQGEEKDVVPAGQETKTVRGGIEYPTNEINPDDIPF